MGDNIIKFLNFEDSNLESDPPEIIDGQRIIRIRQKLIPHFCPVCSYRMHSKGLYERTVNHPIMQDDLPLILKVQQRRWQCTNSACGEIITDEFSFLEKHKHNTKLTDILIVDAFRDPNKTASQIAATFNVSDTYALTTFSKYVDMHRRQLTEAICIDEVHVNISKKCNYALVIQDFSTGEPIDMIANRRQEITEPYFSSIPVAERAKVKYLVSDMYRPYIAYVDKYFPNAISVVDSFHVVKHIVSEIRLYMSRIARKLYKRDELQHKDKEIKFGREFKFYPSREYYIVKHYQWIILKNQQDLRYTDPPKYNSRLGYYVTLSDLEEFLFKVAPELEEFRRLKESYIRFNNKYGGDPRSARPALRKLIQDYRDSGYKIFKDISDTLDYHFESIINSFILIKRLCPQGEHLCRLSNGPMESMNRITQDMKRNCRGFRNFEHLRNRFLFAERRNAQMLAVPLSPEKYLNPSGKKRGSYNKQCNRKEGNLQ